MRILIVLALALMVSRCAETPTQTLLESVCTPEFEYRVYKNGETFRLYMEVGAFSGRNNCRNGHLAVRQNPRVTLRTSVKSLDEVHKLIEKETEKQTQAHIQ